MAAPSPQARSLMRFLETLTQGRVDFTGAPNYAASSDVDTNAEKPNVVNSLIKNHPRGSMHQVVLDIDHPCWVVESSTPGRHHLYIEVPGGISWPHYQNLLNALSSAGVIETGYRNASVRRTFSTLRLPWIKKG